MKKKTAILILFIILSLALTACNRSLSKPPAEVPATAAPEEEEPFVIEEDSTTEEGEEAAKDVEPTEEAEETAQPEEPAPTQPAAEAPTAVHQAPEATAAPTQAPVVIDTPTVPTTYVLQQGEFPYCLARRFNVDPGTLLSTNGLNENSWVSPGTTLSIPTGTTWSGAARSLMAHPATYTVKSGDTIYRIACVFGDVFPESIAQANNMQAPYALTVGQTLQIP